MMRTRNKLIIFTIFALLCWSCEVDNLPQKTPVIANVTVSDITESSAKCTFSINPIGATIKAGVIYDTSQTFQSGAPDVSTTNIVDGTVTLELTGLNSNTNYYCKPYIMDSQGSFIYADISSFNTQNALFLSTSRITSSYMAGNHPLNITASSTWTVTSSQTWCKVQPESGTGNREITVSLTENTTDSLRTATLTITSGNDESRQVTVEQDTKGSSIFNNNIVAAPSFGGGDGTQVDPYLIYNAQHLKKLVDDVNSSRKDYANTYFKLMTDIEVTADEWIPIGYGNYDNSLAYFCGNFDGNGHTISGTLKSNKYREFGFFGYLGGDARISNLTIAATVRNEGNFAVLFSESENWTEITTYTGAIAGMGQNENGIISNCQINGTISGGIANRSLTGGVVGESRVTIQNCNVSNNITGGKALIYHQEITEGTTFTWGGISYTGGLSGRNYGDIINCNVFSSTTITGDECHWTLIGGIVGANSYIFYSGNSISRAKISDCTNSGTIIGSGNMDAFRSNTGGIAGENTGDIINCTVTVAGKVTGGQGGGLILTGGITGDNYGTQPWEENIYYGRIINCTNYAAISGRSCVGGLTGDNTGEIHTSLNIGNISGEAWGIGGLAGSNSSDNYTHIYSCCTNRGTVNGQAANTNNQIGAGKAVEPCPDGHTKR